jgi:5-methylcytosine-specific restriction endonuclease McrA
VTLTRLGPKPTRLRLDSDLYDELREQVLRRDGWRCQACGAMSNLEVHHQEFRSHSGDDLERNLIDHALRYMPMREFVT